MTLSPDLLDYVVFFETEPEWVHPGGWFLGARFTTQRSADRVTVTLAPDDQEFSIDWWQQGVLRVSLKTVMTAHWEILATQGKESLLVTYGQSHLKLCELQLKPHVRVDLVATW